jgi:phenylpropionate dioxygenase-like ring-hydroxylating dioxygenase large terminal subunit
LSPEPTPRRDRLLGLARRMLTLIDTRSTDLAPGLHERPVEVYRSPDLFERERARIFGAAPMLIGLSNEIPTRGSYFTRDIVDTPFLALRDGDGQVRLYLNSCAHRGPKVALEPCGTASRFACPFHAWTYDLGGRLIGVTEPEGFAAMERHSRGLVPLPVAEKHGMIFGCATPGVAIDVDEALGGLGPEMAELGLERMSVFGEAHVHEVAGNWKYAWDTFCENYHFDVLHQKSLKLLDRREHLYSHRQAFDAYGRNVRLVSALRSIEELRGVPEDQWRPEDHLSVQYRLYPSIALSVYPDFIGVFWVLPGESVARARALHITYVARQPESEDAARRLVRALAVACKDVVDGEDFWVTGLAQAAMRAPAARPTYIVGRNEPAVQHFSRLFAEATTT